MPQQIKLPTDMTTIQENGVLSAIITYPGNLINLTSNPLVTTLTILPNILPASQKSDNIKQTVGQQDGIFYKQGEAVLAIRKNNNVNLELDQNGNLIVNAEDGLRYYIDDEGNLIYDYLVPIKDFPY